MAPTRGEDGASSELGGRTVTTLTSLEIADRDPDLAGLAIGRRVVIRYPDYIDVTGRA